MANNHSQERGAHHGLEFDVSQYSLQSRWAAQMGPTIYAGLDRLEGELPYGTRVTYGDETTTVSTQHNQLQETTVQGATVSGLNVTLDFVDGKLSGALVRFLRPHLGRQDVLLERRCVGDSPAGFMDAMSHLTLEAQMHITRGMMTLAERLGIPNEDLRPAADLRDEAEQIRISRSIMSDPDLVLYEEYPPKAA